MNPLLLLRAGATLAASVALALGAPTALAPPLLGPERKARDYTQIRNLQDQPLGRIVDLGVNLADGRIVEVLVVSDSSLGVGNKIVAVPPRALAPDLTNEIYRLDVSPEEFRSAAAIKLSPWVGSGRDDRVAAAYRHFRQEPYFAEDGRTDDTAARPKVALGYIERSSRLLEHPVANLQYQTLGVVSSLTLDITQGRILSVIVGAPGNFRIKSVIPPTALAFNGARDGLILDDTKAEFAAEPQYIYTAAAYGQEANSREEFYRGPRTAVPLEQGTGNRDVDRTAGIHREVRAAALDDRPVQVGTFHERVTLRGWVETAAERDEIGRIAVAGSHLELVDHQILVGQLINSC